MQVSSKAGRAESDLAYERGACMSEPNRPYALPPGAGQPMEWFTSRIILKASSPEIGVIEVTMSPGEEPPLHVHKNEDEWFYIAEGEMAFHAGGETFGGRS